MNALRGAYWIHGFLMGLGHEWSIHKSEGKLAIEIDILNISESQYDRILPIFKHMFSGSEAYWIEKGKTPGLMTIWIPTDHIISMMEEIDKLKLKMNMIPNDAPLEF